MKPLLLVLAAVVTVGCQPQSSGQGAAASGASPLEGQWAYVGTLKGHASLVNGHFIFLYGGSADTATMIGTSGTYQIAHDTATGHVLYSTLHSEIGKTYRWTAESWAGDTISYVVLNDSGRVSGRGRAVKVRS